MAGRIFCIVILSFSVGARAGDQPPDPPRREAGERARPAKSSVASRRRMLYHLAEGSEIFPLDWLLTLKSVKTGKPFLEDPERFGLIPDPEILEIPGTEGVKLPIGLTIGTPPDVLAAAAAIKRPPGPPDPLAILMVGVNCAACHVGRLRYHNKDLPITEGAPNLFNIDSFYQELFQSALASKKFTTDDEADPMRRFPAAYGLLSNRREFLKTLASLHTGGAQATGPGPGRIDAFGNVRRLVFTKAPQVPLNAPVSFPHLWGVRQLKWFHWDGNTNSLMERNIGQAMGLGAIADLQTGASTISPLNIHTLESFFSRLTPPDWPEDHFGAVDTASEQYRRGATLYVQHCASCHDRQEGGHKSPRGSITYGVQELGTDPLRARNFAERLEHQKPFTRELQAVAEKVKNHADMGPNSGEHRGPLDLPDEQIGWLTTLGYVARPLEGVWATAPYLHNGSVPTLDDLLKPDEERPVCFPLGHREYDPVKLGYVSEFSKVPAAEQSHFFVYDTRIDGNSNRGHNYGTHLASYDREALLEYLKVMDPPDIFAAAASLGAARVEGSPAQIAGVVRKAPGMGMEDVPANENNDIEALKSLQIKQMTYDADEKHAKPMDRGQHPKHHGFLAAKFTISESVPRQLRHGLFSEPKTYRAVIRFSSTGVQDDTGLDNHGMAIKLVDVKPTGMGDKQKDAKTTIQDFVLLDHPLFFAPNVATLLAFSREKERLVSDKGLKGKEVLEALNGPFPKEVGLIEGRKKHINSPLEVEYFSTTPYKFGETAVKYSAKPEKSRDYLREILVEQFRSSEKPGRPSTTRHPAARFGFYIQRQTDPVAMPIEDPTVEWKSAWEKVATIEIDAQEFDFPDRWNWGNRLSFSPWHALEEHRPLGGINRARKLVYPASSKLRHENLNPPTEANASEIPVKK
jgi:hypothetical protein